MRHLIYCATPGCRNPAREVGQPADCPDCRKTLCEDCCDREKARRAKGTT